MNLSWSIVALTRNEGFIDQKPGKIQALTAGIRAASSNAVIFDFVESSINVISSWPHSIVVIILMHYWLLRFSKIEKNQLALLSPTIRCEGKLRCGWIFCFGAAAVMCHWSNRCSYSSKSRSRSHLWRLCIFFSTKNNKMSYAYLFKYIIIGDTGKNKGAYKFSSYFFCWVWLMWRTENRCWEILSTSPVYGQTISTRPWSNNWQVFIIYIRFWTLIMKCFFLQVSNLELEWLPLMASKSNYKSGTLYEKNKQRKFLWPCKVVYNADFLFRLDKRLSAQLLDLTIEVLLVHF